MTPSKIDVAWAAGLFEGEGCITQVGKIKSPRLKLQMTDFDVVRRFKKIVRCGNLCTTRFKNKKYKIQLVWYTGRKAVVAKVLEMLLPYFGMRRRRRAKEVHKRCFTWGNHGRNQS